MEEHGQFLSCLPKEDDNVIPEIRDLPEFTSKVLGWESEDLIAIPQREPLTGDMASLEVVLPQYHETLRPTRAVPVFRPEEGQNPWMMLVQEIPTGSDLDEAGEADSSKHWHAAPQAKFERLLRETDVPIGLLSNGCQLRLVYSPRGESSGYATFNVDEMVQVAGRPMFAALHMLLSAERMFSLGDDQRLPAILENSRRYQNNVSTQLAEQVMSALFDLLRGFQAANDHRKGELLGSILNNDPQHVYHGLLTVLMRLVFILYAEDRGLISTDPIYANHYSVSGLFDRLRAEHGRFPDTMDQRFGAWAQLLALFRMISGGGQHGEMRIPPREGYLFDPNRYPFLEGRFDDNDVNIYSDPERRSPINIPRVSDGVVFRVLSNLLVLDGERLSYRTLDVEQIGSVYEAIMGFEIEVAGGRSIAIKPQKKHGAPATINLDRMLEMPGKDRAKWLKEHTDQKLGTADAKAMKEATTIDELLLALNKKVAKTVTPNVVPEGSIVFQPSDERRRSGSHYTPRSLTEPIVRTTLAPILNQLVDPDKDLPTLWEPTSADKKRFTKGEIALRIKASERHINHAQAAREKGTPHPSQILDLKICDPAMGSGAFLVEACRQLGDHLIAAWHAHDMVPPDIPADEDEVLYARRLVAQRCLYGVDKNVMAVDLAKLSLWLVTLARDHAFTFLDHSLRHGDSLVGLTREQIIGFHWDRKKFKTLLNEPIQKRLDRATEARAKILNAREDVQYRDQEQRLKVADDAIGLIRILGDACVSCFFAESKKKAREEEADRVYGLASSYLESQKQPRVDHASRTGLQEAAARLRDSSQEHPVPAFHWEIEFPEVFSRENAGFDAFVGNPPFAGKNNYVNANPESFLDWLKTQHPETHGAADIVAHFFRRVFDLLRNSGTLGLVATNTIGQGDTRSTGLRWICENGGTIFSARRGLRWPGVAAVIVNVIHVVRGRDFPRLLDGRSAPFISAFLFHRGGHADPHVLKSNQGISFQGSNLSGIGFTFDDDDTKGLASSIADYHSLIESSSKNRECLFPYIGGQELNSSPTQAPRRFVINFRDRTEAEARQYPDLMQIVEDKVKPDRMKNKRATRKKYWWRFGETTPALFEALARTKQVLAISLVTKHMSFAFLPAHYVFSHKLGILIIDSHSAFALLQSRVHEIWARFFGSTLEDRLNYSTTDCFDTFPFPLQADLEDLNDIGRRYYSERATLMSAANEGLTDTYNRFHSPEERNEGILGLRRLHGLMDGAVLRAYGWDDLADQAAKPDFCQFLLDYEEEEEDEPGSKKSKKKKPWRYRWPDDFRDEVLARLLELNEQRHKEELLLAKQSTKAEKEEKKPKESTKGKAKAMPDDAGLFSTTLEREHHCLLMLLRQWEGRSVSRRVLNAGIILMLDDSLRSSVLSNSNVSSGNKKSSTTINQLFTDLEIDGYIEQADSEHQQLWRITEAAPVTELSADDQKRVEEVLEFLNRERETGKVTISEEVVDADVDLIPA
ncbi:Eco57I restriction-modification methylase domain-containing protein [Stieleria maiorica]|nr:type IIL restriction-modification enzyme MmeI [Stieleria maiorica]